MTQKNKNVGLWQPSILLPTPAQKCMWFSSGHVPLHNYFKNKEYLNFSFDNLLNIERRGK